MAMKELVRLLDIKRQDFEQACNDQLGFDKYLIFQSGRQESGISASHNDRDGTKSIFGLAQHAFYFENHALGSTELHRVQCAIPERHRRPSRFHQWQSGSVLMHRGQSHLETWGNIATDEDARIEDHIIGDARAAVNDEDMLIWKKSRCTAGGCDAIPTKSLRCAVEYFDREWSGVGEFDVLTGHIQLRSGPVAISASGSDDVVDAVIGD